MRWNRTAALFAWGVWLICMTIPRFSKGSDWRTSTRTFSAFLRAYPPPGYRPDPPAKRRA